MTREEAYDYAMRACESTWNNKVCADIRKALEQDLLESEEAKLQKAYNKGFEDGRKVNSMNQSTKLFIRELQNLRKKLECAYDLTSHDEGGNDAKVCMDGLELSYLMSALSMYIHVVNESDERRC